MKEGNNEADRCMNYICTNDTLKALKTKEAGFISAKQRTLKTCFINTTVYLQNIYSNRTQKESGASTELMERIGGLTTVFYELSNPMLSRQIELKIFTFFLSFFWSLNDSVVSAEAQGFCITVPHTKRKSMQLDSLANINSLISFRYYRRNGLGEI